MHEDPTLAQLNSNINALLQLSSGRGDLPTLTPHPDMRDVQANLFGATRREDDLCNFEMMTGGGTFSPTHHKMPHGLPKPPVIESTGQ